MQRLFSARGKSAVCLMAGRAVVKAFASAHIKENGFSWTENEFYIDVQNSADSLLDFSSN